jgi:glyoxylase-like metal-dependent hydrolase (beta-lactamase superfamily II)
MDQSAPSRTSPTIINTHTHGDHTGSNEFFGATIETVVQENTKANMAKMDEFAGPKAQFLPKKTYKDTMKIGSGKDEIDLYYFGRGHTNGDAFVVFPALRTMHVGDIFAWKALPFVDAANGGSVIDQPKTLAKAVATVKNVDTIINGHIPVSTWRISRYGSSTRVPEATKAAGGRGQRRRSFKMPEKFRTTMNGEGQRRDYAELVARATADGRYVRCAHLPVSSRLGSGPVDISTGP